MVNLKRIALISMAVVAASATSALAGTKYATNLVSNSPNDPPTNPTLSPKSKITLSDKGILVVSLAGVTTPAVSTTLASTSQAYNLSVKADPTLPTLDGSEYVVTIRLNVVAINGLLPVIEVPVPVDLTAGKGKTKLNLSGLLGNLPAGLSRSIEVTGSEVWGPLGAPAACLAYVGAPIPAIYTYGDPACRGGTQIGLSGINVPLP